MTLRVFIHKWAKGAKLDMIEQDTDLMAEPSYWNIHDEHGNFPTSEIISMNPKNERNYNNK